MGTYTPGLSTTYTITVSNAGPSDVVDATVADTFPAEVTATSWTCAADPGASCTASGTGNISDATVDLPAGTSVIYTVAAQTDVAATGDLVNTATVTPPAGVSDPAPGDETDTDTDTPALSADL